MSRIVLICLAALALAACGEESTYFGPGGAGGETDGRGGGGRSGADAAGGGALDAGSLDSATGDDTSPTLDAGPAADTAPVDAAATGSLNPGEACQCDDSCAGDADHPGLCVNGVCMQSAITECVTSGSAAECNDGLRCWGEICYPDCDSFSCDGECDDDGSCIWSADTTCSDSCSAICESPHNGSECPENSHVQDDGCACDEGFVPNADGTACVADGGGDGECPPNSSPGDEPDTCYCDEGFVVNAAGTACVRECEGDGDCSGGQICEDNACVDPPCTTGSCPDGLICADSGNCIVDLGTAPAGPIPNCSSVADWMCEGGELECGGLHQFAPVDGPGYTNYPLNGESRTNQYRSFARNDVIALVKYATGMVDCLAGDWAGSHDPLGLGDMSEADGAIPGTSIGEPGHPEGTHVDGYDMDIAYYQVGEPNNYLRPVCEHTRGGSDQYHCVSEPSSLDAWRTALFIAFLHDSPQLRVIGVDGKVGPLVEAAVDQLCSAGWYDGPACRSMELAFETTDEGRGWYHFHHHHLHLSLTTRSRAGFLTRLPEGAVAPLPRGNCSHAASTKRPGRLLPFSVRVR